MAIMVLVFVLPLSLFTVASCDNSGVSVCIVATGYMKVPLLQVDIAIPEDGHF